MVYQKFIAALISVILCSVSMSWAQSNDPLEEIRRALTLNSGKEPPIHEVMIATQRKIGEFFRLGLNDKALSLAVALPIYLEEQLGKDHPATLKSIADLAMSYQNQGHYKLAEPLFRQALSEFEKIHDKNHPTVLVYKGNLAWLYYLQGRYEIAEPMLKKVAEGLEQGLGKDHRQTLISS